MEPEWKEVTKEEFDRLKFNLAQSGRKLEGHTITFSEPPIWVLFEDTGKKCFYDELFLLKIDMDWMGPDGQLMTSIADREKFWMYFKNVREEAWKGTTNSD